MDDEGWMVMGLEMGTQKTVFQVEECVKLAWLGHCQCGCLGEIARDFVGAKEADIGAPALCQELSVLYISSSDSHNSSERKRVLFSFAILQINRFIGYVACLRSLAAGKF